ncbi:Hyccin [Manis pentadactyla]|nr:Hyccin [Manis pentadactyla]
MVHYLLADLFLARSYRREQSEKFDPTEEGSLNLPKDVSDLYSFNLQKKKGRWCRYSGESRAAAVAVAASQTSRGSVGGAREAALVESLEQMWKDVHFRERETSLPNYATNLKDKSSLVSSLYKVIQEPQSELLEPVCHQLFEFYRSGEEQLLRFTLQFLPELIWCYLAVSASRNVHSSGCIEALLLGVYNLEIVDKHGHSKVLSFTIPSLSKPSVYHEPSSIGSMALTESALSQHGLSKVVYSGPHPQREMLTAQNRFEVLTFLLLCYNAALTYMPSVSLQSLCQICSRICVCGYPRQHVRKYKGISSRIPVSSGFMVQMLTGIYFAFYNGEWDLAQKALDDITYRAQLELYPEPLLVANAIKASLPHGTMKSSKEGTRCIQVEITPTSSRISRNAVTSMSIRGHRWKRHEQPDNNNDTTELGILVIPEISVTNVAGERTGNGEKGRTLGEIDAQHIQEHFIAALQGNTELTGQEELMEISEVDEGFYSRAASSTSQSGLSNSSHNSSNKTGVGKTQRRSGGGKTGGKEKETSAESCKDHFARKQTQRAQSENLELLSLKRLTLTTSQSLPKPSSHGLAKTATTVFSKSFEQVSGVTVPHNPSSAGGCGTGIDANRFSACSLQEEKLIYGSERTELPVKHQSDTLVLRWELGSALTGFYKTGMFSTSLMLIHAEAREEPVAMARELNDTENSGYEEKQTETANTGPMKNCVGIAFSEHTNLLFASYTSLRLLLETITLSKQRFHPQLACALLFAYHLLCRPDAGRWNKSGMAGSLGPWLTDLTTLQSTASVSTLSRFLLSYPDILCSSTSSQGSMKLLALK